jgi:glycosyltransferase involved in cell wall biosynthesis
MKILIATPLAPSQIGGPAQYAVGLGTSLERAGHTVETLTFQRVSALPTGLRHVLLFVLALTKMRDSDAVIILDTFSMALPVTLAAHVWRKKVIIRAGGDFVWEQYIERTKDSIQLSKFYTTPIQRSRKERLIMWLQRHIVYASSNTLVLSTDWLFTIWERPYALSRGSVHVIQNPAPPKEAERRAAHTDTNVIVWMGRDIVLKNVRTLDEAVRRVRVTHPTIRFEKYSSLSHAEVGEVLSRCRALIIPSLSEVSPNLALEALALGVPVVLTSDCGLRDLLADAVVWVDPLSVDDVTEKIAWVMSDAGYKDALERASAFTYCRSYTEVAADFLELISKSSGRE